MSRNLPNLLPRFLSARIPGHSRKSSASRRAHRLWVLEGLEDRRLLAATIYTVKLTTDNGPTAAGQSTGTDTGDLRYCITQANANPNKDGSQIQFDPEVFDSSTPQTITLSASFGTLNLSETAGPEAIRP